MGHVPWSSRVVEVIADFGPSNSDRYRFGSGCVVVGRTVLTAAHVVAGAESVVVRGPDKVKYTAAMDPGFVGSGAGPDLALIEVEDPDFVQVPALPLATVDRARETPVVLERCHATGYPWFAEQRSAGTVRDTQDAWGDIAVASKMVSGLLSLQITRAPRELPAAGSSLVDSPWSGMSGAPVVADGYLLGVVSEHAPREGAGSITVTPLTALEKWQDGSERHAGVAEPQAWWERLGEAGPDGLTTLPRHVEAEPPAYVATVRDIRELTRPLVGREDELADLVDFATASAGYRWLVGSPWAGKSSLLAEAVAGVLPEQVDVVSYFLQRRAADADSDNFVAAVVPQLAALVGEEVPAAEPHQLNRLWQQAVARANETRRHLVLVVDGLDEDIGPPQLPSVAARLPAIVGGHANVLVASRPHPELPDDVPVGHPLRAIDPIELEPFEGHEQEAALARAELNKVFNGDDDLAVDVLGLLAAAAGPLSIADLATLSNNDVRPIRKVVTGETARSLQPVGPQDRRRYQFAHDSLLEHAQGHQDVQGGGYRQRIHDWAASWRAKAWPADDEMPRYLLDAYPATLYRDDPARHARLIADVGWVDAAIQAVGVDRVLADLRAAEASGPEAGRLAALVAAVRGQAHNLRPPAPVSEPGYVIRQLVMHGAELGDEQLAAKARDRLRTYPDPGLVPVWTTRRTSPALLADLGGHDGPVGALADGRVVFGGDNGRVLLMDPAAPGAGPVELAAHDGQVSAIAVMEDGRVVSGGLDGWMLLMDPVAPSAAPVELGAHHGYVDALVASRDGRVVSGGLDGSVLLWDPATPSADPVELGAHDGRVTALAVLADGRVLSGGLDGWVLVWDLANPGADPVELGRLGGSVWSVAALPDGRPVTGDSHGKVLLWDPATPAADPVVLGVHEPDASGAYVYSLAVLADGRLVSAGSDGRLRLWDPAAPGAHLVELGHHEGGSIYSVAVLPEGRLLPERVVSSGADGRMRLWDPAAASANPADLGRRDSDEAALAVLADGRVVAGGYDGRLRLRDPAAAGADPIEFSGTHGPVDALAVLADGRVLSSSWDGWMRLWDPNAPRDEPVELGRSGDSLAILRDGRVVSSGSTRGELLLWDPATPGTDPVELGRHGSPITTVGVLPDGRVVSGCDDGRVLLWDPGAASADPVELGRHGSPITTVGVLPDGRVVSGCDDGRVLLWDPGAASADPVELASYDDSVRAVAVLADGRVATGTEDGPVRLWNLAVAPLDPSHTVSCSTMAMAASPQEATGNTMLIISHFGGGLTGWSAPLPE